MQDIGLAPETADELLLPYENRPSTVAGEEAGKRRRGIALGWELNRIQGATRSPLSVRLAELFCTGRITREEYTALSAKLAIRGLLRVKDQRADAD